MSVKTVFAVASMLVCLHASALDLQLKSGRILPDVRVYNAGPHQVEISFTSSDESVAFENVLYGDLTEQSLYELAKYLVGKYNSGKGFDRMPALTSALFDTVTVPDESGANGGKKRLRPLFPDRVYFRSVGQVNNGTVGWITSAEQGYLDDGTSLGEVYVYGLNVPQGGTWAGKIFATNRSISAFGNVYRCYALSRNTAEMLDSAGLDAP